MDLEASFAVDSFSTFTVTWHKKDLNTTRTVTITFYLYEDGKTDTRLGVPRRTMDASTDTSLRFVEGECPPLHIDGYRLVCAEGKRTDKPDEPFKDIDEVRYFVVNGSWWGLKSYYNGQTIDTVTSKLTPSYLVNAYYEKVDPVATGALYISDDVVENGSLKADFDASQWTGASAAPNLDSSVYYYKWYRQGPGDADFALVPYQLERSIPIFYDGAQATYYVELWAVGDDSGPVATSFHYQVPYYNQLQNGSFETPRIPTTQESTAGYIQYTNGVYPELVWQTTGLGALSGRADCKGHDIEIITVENHYPFRPNARDNYGETAAADGVQFAELNCEYNGALYQDVLTIPGEELYWWASHQARDGNKEFGWPTKRPEAELPENLYDTMYVVIMDAEVAANHVSSQAQIDQLLAAAKAQNLTAMTEGQTESSAKGQGKEITTTVDGVQVTATVWKVTSNADGWHDYLDTYMVPEGQYLTRFFFSAGTVDELASHERTRGNLLDNVGFSQSYQFTPDEAGLTVRKTVAGLAQGTTIEANSFTFEVYDTNQPDAPIQTITLPAVNTQAPGNGTVTFSTTLSDLDPGTYTVSETDPTGVVLSGHTYQRTTVAVGSATAQEGLASGIIPLNGGSSQMVSFVNQYSQNVGDLSITKIVEDSSNPSGNPDKEFTFHITYPELQVGTGLGYVVTGDTGGAGMATFGMVQQDADGNAYFPVKIKQNQTATIQKLPAGVTVTVSEPDHEGYAVKWQVDGGAEASTPSASATIKLNDTVAIVCTNSTGFSLPSTGGPGVTGIVSLGAALTLCAGALLLPGRRKGDKAR